MASRSAALAAARRLSAAREEQLAEAVAAYERAQALVGDNYPPLKGMLDRARASAEAEKGR